MRYKLQIFRKWYEENKGTSYIDSFKVLENGNWEDIIFSTNLQVIFLKILSLYDDEEDNKSYMYRISKNKKEQYILFNSEIEINNFRIVKRDELDTDSLDYVEKNNLNCEKYYYDIQKDQLMR